LISNGSEVRNSSPEGVYKKQRGAGNRRTFGGEGT
jgi:hypothetical protein